MCFKYMKQLKHLYLPSYYRVCGKLELGNLYYLQTLENVQPKTIQIPTGFKFNRLRDLDVDTTEQAQEDGLHILVSICPYIYKLTLYGVIKKFPEVHQFSLNIAEMSLTLTSLEEDPMAILEKLPNLKSLRCSHKAFLGKKMVCSERGFPWLQSLCLFGFYELEELRVEEGAMPSLQRLKIGYCKRLVASIPQAIGSVWRPPNQSWFKLNFDAAIFAEQKSSGFGAVIRNNQGEVMAAMATKGPPVSCSEEAETMACRKALEFAVDAGFHELIVEGDNITVMRAVSSSTRNFSMLGTVIADIHCLLCGLRGISISCVHRDGNRVAHVLAKFAKGIDEDMYWIEEVPQVAEDSVYQDSILMNS
ncbi:hypothetical protein SO802_028130 [Lithocarpus litseifolius]|uniref:RNase H type-1 domain-containing protein n=1 Tax=Lithocarpus litseifolius TaxID=425828 RepID=A0AAW2BPN3_9ROSI